MNPANASEYIKFTLRLAQNIDNLILIFSLEVLVIKHFLRNQISLLDANSLVIIVL